MDKPTAVTRIWDNWQQRTEFIRYTVVFNDGRHAMMNAEPLHVSKGKFWTAQGKPFRYCGETEIAWDDLPRDCQEAVLIHLQEEQAAA